MSENGMTSRVQGLLEGFHASRPEVFAERAVLVTQAYAESEGLPIAVRRALALARILAGTTVLIRDGELIVGCKTPAVLGSTPRSPATGWRRSSIPSRFGLKLRSR
jgi:pyruvate-formate lyase